MSGKSAVSKKGNKKGGGLKKGFGRRPGVKAVTKSTKAGLAFPVARIHRRLRDVRFNFYIGYLCYREILPEES